MNEITIKTEMYNKCVVISEENERKWKIRSIIENGKVYYLRNRHCFLYGLCSPKQGRGASADIKNQDAGISNRRKGVTDTWCFERENESCR